MIKITAKAIVKEENRAKFLEVAGILVEESRKEEGNIAYGLFQDTESRGTLTFLEDWKDMKAIEIHGKTGHFTAAIVELEKLAESFEINLYESAL